MVHYHTLYTFIPFIPQAVIFYCKILFFKLRKYPCNELRKLSVTTLHRQRLDSFDNTQ
jgi:hypothetical protein